MEERTYDIIVYGASGFTGQYAALEMVRTCVGKKMAIAGRSKTKLEQTLRFIEEEIGSEFDNSHFGIVIADNDNEDSIMEMCRQCHVVANCVGPYRWYGELVVKCCVQSSTHYVDVSGEPEFLQMCQTRYHKEAEEKGIHIVGACGFDSVPADVGLELLREKFPGQLTAAESYVYFYGGGKINYGTYSTIIHSLANYSSLVEQQKDIAKMGKLSYVGPKLTFQTIGFNNSVKKWFLPFKGADPTVVKRTQRYESSVFGKTPLQYGAYFAFPSFLHMIGVLMFLLNMFILTRFNFGIKLLERFPSFFSLGAFCKRARLDKDEILNSGFTMVFYGQGYKLDVSSQERGKSSPHDQFLSLKFTGPNAGYLFTSSALIAAASTLLDDQLSNKGGVLTPASAFCKTGFVDRLLKRGVKIEFS